MQEVYDSRVLHQWLGVVPEATITVDVKQNGEKSPNKSTSQANEESVRSAWNEGEADMELESSDVEVNDRRVAEESRYDIADLPPKKRRRTGKSKDIHTVFVLDDEDEEGENVAEGNGTTEEEAEYDVAGSADDGQPGSSRQTRRSYWLSKANSGVVDSE